MNAPARFSAAARHLEEVAQLIGQVNLRELIKRMGGTRIYVPAQIGHNHPIAATIGMKASALLAEHYSGTTLELPKAHLRRERVLEMALSGQMTIAEAAIACDYTERRVYQLLDEAKRKAGDGSDDQLDMFAGN